LITSRKLKIYQNYSQP